MLLIVKAACSWNFYDQQHLIPRALLFLFLASSSSFLIIPRAVQAIADCNYSQPHVCGSLSIPYPFGMSPECGLAPYRISCKQNASYGDGELAFLQLNSTSSTPELQVLAFSSSTLTVNSTHLKAMPSASNCSANASATVELPEEGPFVMGESNLFAVMGCDAEGIAFAHTGSDSSSPISCPAGCYNDIDMPFCNYYACCTSSLPPGSWRLDFQASGIAYADFPDVCGFSTVLSPSTYTSTQKGVFGAGHYGLYIAWALQSSKNCSEVRQSPEYACSKLADCIDAPLINGYNCNCTQGYKGDGYKAGNGCEDIDECQEQTDGCEKPPLGVCTNTNGSYKCSCASGEGSGLPGTCRISDKRKRNLIVALVGTTVGLAMAIGLLCACKLRRAIQRRIKDREHCFKRAAGDQVSSITLFSERELIDATQGFSDAHVLGEGGFGKVYRGKLSQKHGDNVTVAIKRPKQAKGAMEEQLAQLESFAREIVLLNKVMHNNVVRFVGCCVGTSVPFLVYEYVERGTLGDYLTPQSRDFVWQGKKVQSGSSSMWAWRLHIAVQTAEAVSYLHSMSEPIFHLDLKVNNILIDKHYNPKVADFGIACFLTSDVTHITNQLPAGTLGYIVDPEYCHSLHVTNKCDVYSFGVILLELISGKPARGPNPEPLLAHQFRSDVDMSVEIRKHSQQGLSFIDRRLGTEADVLGNVGMVADLAHQCVALKGVDRPSMQEVARKLIEIQSDLKLQGLQDLYGVNIMNESSEGVVIVLSDGSASSNSSLFIAPESPSTFK